MIFNVIPYHIIGNLFSNCSVEISLFPKVASPKLILNFRELVKNLAARYTLYYPYHFRYRVSWGKRNQYVNVIFSHCTSIYFKIKMTGYFIKKLFYSWLNVFNKYLFPIFRAPDQMVFGFINRMACSFDTHAGILMGMYPFYKPYGCRNKNRAGVGLYGSQSGRPISQVGIKQANRVRTGQHVQDLTPAQTSLLFSWPAVSSATPGKLSHADGRYPRHGLSDGQR